MLVPMAKLLASGKFSANESTRDAYIFDIVVAKGFLEAYKKLDTIKEQNAEKAKQMEREKAAIKANVQAILGSNPLFVGKLGK